MTSPQVALALETSTTACSVALAEGADIHEDFRVIPRQHSRMLLPMVDQLLVSRHVSRRDLDLVVYGRGPGSFTGLRLAAGVAQGLAFALDIPAVGVSTLAALAQGATNPAGRQWLAVAMEARQTEIYFGAFERVEGVVAPVGEEQLVDASKLQFPEGGRWWGIGSGWRHRAAIEAATGQHVLGADVEALPHAKDLVPVGLAAYRRGEWSDAVDVQPVYLRERVARKPGAHPPEPQ